MKKRFTRILAALALLVGLTIPMGMWGQAPVNTVLWGETWTDGGNAQPSAYDFTGTTVYGNATLTYANSSTSTKLYNEALAGGTAPELLLAKNNSTWTITGIPSGSATGLTLSFKANYDRTVVSTTTEGVTVGTKAFSNNTVSYPISVASNVSSFVLVFTNTNSGNVRIDDIQLVVTTAGGGQQLISTTTTIAAPQDFNNDLYVGASAGTLTASVTETNGGAAVSGATVTWSSTNTSVATVDENGVVTLVAVGTTNITATYAGNTTYAPSTGTYQLNVVDNTPFNGVLFDATEDTGTSPIVKDNVSLACTNGVLDNGSEYRFYKNSTTTISTTDGSTITKIEFINASSNPATGFASQTGWTTNSNGGVWQGEATSVQFVASGAQVRATEIRVSVVANTNPVITANDVNILYDATSGSITYTITNGVEGGAVTSAVVTASNPENWLTVNGSNPYESPISLSCAANTTATEKTATVTLTYTYNRETVTETVNVTQAANPNATMTIAEVRAQGTGSVVTTGIVTSCVGTTGYIQDATAAICVYGAGLTVGDEIKVSGSLTTYKGLLEIEDPQVTVLSSGNTTNPEEMTIAAINASTNQGWYVRIVNATITEIGSNSNYTIAQGESTITLHGNLGVSEVAVNDIISLNGNIGCFNTVQIVNPQNVEVQHNTTPVINASNPETLAYNATSGSIAYTIENPVTGTSLTATVPSDSWITLGTITSEAVPFTCEANTGAVRTETVTLIYGSITKEVTVTQAAYEAPFEPATYTLATSIQSGKTYIIVGNYELDGENNYCAMGEQRANNRGGVAISVDGNTATVSTAEVHEVVITALTGEDAGKYTIQDGGYLYAASSGSNYLRTETELDNNGKWTIAIDEEGVATIVAQGGNTRNEMRFNANIQQGVASPIFSCYASTSTTGSLPRLYVKVPTLNITGYDTSAGGYVLLASPVSTTPAAAGMITDTEGANATPETATYDLYSYVQSEELEWRNYRANSFELVPGKGYLYASKNGVTLYFDGEMSTGFADVTLPYNASDFAKSIYLAGNSLTEAQTFYVYDNNLNKQTFNYITLNGEGSAFVVNQATSYSAPALQGFFVQAAGENWTLSTADMDADAVASLLNVKVLRNTGSLLDNAIVSFGNGSMMNKFYLSNNTTRVYIPQNNREMAVVRSAAEAEMPVSFRASENGTYTLAIETENVEMNYLHLIDNLTGMDVDLLQTPSYTFEAKTSDYASRFRLVFKANGTNENNAETFAYFNGTNWTVSNVGDATLQVVDVTGRTVANQMINGNAELNLNQPAGVYVIRLVNGDNVKTQKVVVR